MTLNPVLQMRNDYNYSAYLDDQSKAYIFQDRRRPRMGFVERTGTYLQRVLKNICLARLRNVLISSDTEQLPMIYAPSKPSR